jgi:ferrous iron transport protein B
MFAVFALIFWVAQYPMEWIETGFGYMGSVVGRWVPPGDVRSLLVDGVIGGVGGVLVFLPQICILFFFLALLEDTGYLARAAFVMDRLMRRVGLPGKAFVPILSAHACAIPAIMSSRVIEDRRDRLVTILVLPLFSCSARIPVYAMITALLFPSRPVLAGLVFTGAYVLGIVAALIMALVFKRSILPGESRPLVLELPSYKLPNLRTALLTSLDRAKIFIKRAGTIILAVSILLWFLASFPRSEPPAAALALQAEAQELSAVGQSERAEELVEEATQLSAQSRLAQSFAGRAGRAIEPVLRPLGFDWQIGIGVLSSFAAREVIVSTLAVVYGVGESATNEDPSPLYDSLRSAVRSDGTPVFTTATSVSLLIFYVLAMQCLSTQAVTRRETNSWKWPAFQLLYMTILAYSVTFLVYQLLRTWTLG